MYSGALGFTNLIRSVVTKTPFRNYATLLSKEFQVSQFCIVDVKCPYRIIVTPIDVFHRQDRTKIKLESQTCDSADVRCSQNGDTVSIEANGTSSDIELQIETSVKAGLKIIGEDKNITLGSFYGPFVNLQTRSGNVDIEKLQCENISITTSSGNVTCKDPIQAGVINITTKSGVVHTDRIQGLQLTIMTTSGEIRTGSTYCDNSAFITDFGHMILNNVHKNTSIDINHEGMLNLTGFDGVLKTNIKKGLVDVQISRLERDSSICLEESGTLILRLSDLCQKNTTLNISSDNCVVGENVKLKRENFDGGVCLKPTTKTDVNFTVNCKNAHVLVDTSSWSQMFSFKR